MFLVNKYMFRACNDLGRWGHPPIACLVGGVPTAHLSRIIISIGARRFFTRRRNACPYRRGEIYKDRFSVVEHFVVLGSEGAVIFLRNLTVSICLGPVMIGFS
ncbi:hypothetical protein D3C86_368170 [compost metagenome]